MLNDSVFSHPRLLGIFPRHLDNERAITLIFILFYNVIEHMPFLLNRVELEYSIYVIKRWHFFVFGLLFFNILHYFIFLKLMKLLCVWITDLSSFPFLLFLFFSFLLCFFFLFHLYLLFPLGFCFRSFFLFFIEFFRCILFFIPLFALLV